MHPRWTYDGRLLEPIWRSPTMYAESVLFVREEGAEAPHASLLFEPTSVPSLQSASGETTYVEGRDWRWRPGTRRIVLPPGSRVVWRSPADLRRPAGTQPYDLTHRDGNGEILFGAAHEYHDMQTAVTYRRRAGAWNGPAPARAAVGLSRTRARLEGRQPLSVALLGDSISVGCNASGWAGVPPYQPAYPGLLAAHLESAFGSSVALANLAVEGADTLWGLEHVGELAPNEPDLVILAFGMNDAAGRPAAEFGSNTAAMIAAVQKARPAADIILVAPMLGNADWITLRPELFPQYRDALAGLCGPGIALADVWCVWAELRRRKQDRDMTGNGVNHPNDFGHRVYAQVLSALF